LAAAVLYILRKILNTVNKATGNFTRKKTARYNSGSGHEASSSTSNLQQTVNRVG